MKQILFITICILLSNFAKSQVYTNKADSLNNYNPNRICVSDQKGHILYCDSLDIIIIVDTLAYIDHLKSTIFNIQQESDSEYNDCQQQYSELATKYNQLISTTDTTKSLK